MRQRSTPLRSLRDAIVKPSAANSARTVRGLPGADFEAGDAARREQPPDLRREAAIGVEAVGPGIERRLGLPARDIGRQGRPGFDIRRVAEDEIEALVQALAPVAEPEFGARESALRRA